jgi:hypothetical protein
MLEGFALYVFLSILVERLTEAVFGLPFDKYEKAQPYKWLLVYVGMVVGVAVAWFGHLDLISELSGVELGALGVFLTGLAVGGGSNLLHQVWPGSPSGG